LGRGETAVSLYALGEEGLMSDWELETERLRLRRISLDDAEFMLEIWNDPAFVRHVGDRGVRTIEQAHEAMKSGALKLYADYGYGPYAMVLKSDGSRIGICGLFRRMPVRQRPPYSRMRAMTSVFAS
jgi:RimJ/RimL family protein N-acetyltransferase